MTYMGFGRILLKAGETLEYTVTGEEQAVVLQQGDFQVWAEYDGKMVINGREGQRGNVYDDMPTAVYLPPRAKVKFTSKNGCEARVYTAYCDEGNAPYFCPPEEIEEGEPGEYIYKRKYRFIFGQPAEIASVFTKIASGVTLINSLLSTVCAVILYLALRPALEKAHLLPKD